MIDADTRKAVWTLHERGMSLREIAAQLKIGRNTIRRIIRRGGRLEGVDQPGAVAAPKTPPGPVSTQLDLEKLGKLYLECEGWVQRIHEELLEQGIEVGYSTLTRIIREQG
jgi:transposase